MSTFKGMDNWNWHYAMDFGALNICYLQKNILL